MNSVAACFLFLFVGNALAQDLLWSSAVDLSSAEQFSDGAQIAVSSDGTKATAVWRSVDSGNATNIQSVSATINAGIASWGSISTLSPGGQDANVPQISLSSDGTRATVVWLKDINGSSSVIQSVSATISGSVANWSAVSDVSATGGGIGEPRVSLSSDGSKATAIWSRYNGSNYVVQSASSMISGSSASWSAAADLSVAGEDAHDPQVALSFDGTKATAIWYRGNSYSSVVQSASAVITGNTAGWSAGLNLSDTGQAVHFPQISGSLNGERATAVWGRWNGSSIVVQSASATITGSAASWGVVTDLSASTHVARGPQIAVSANGKKAAAIWSSDEGPSTVIRSASAAIAGNSSAWGNVVGLTAGGKTASSPQISISSDGSKYAAVWQRWNILNVVIQSTTARVVGNTVHRGAVVSLTTEGQNASAPQIATSLDSKSATAIWLRKNIVQSASVIEHKEGDGCYVINSKNDKVVVFCL